MWSSSTFGAGDALALHEAKDAHVRHTGMSGLFAGKDASLGISDVYPTGACEGFCNCSADIIRRGLLARRYCRLVCSVVADRYLCVSCMCRGLAWLGLGYISGAANRLSQAGYFVRG